MVVELEQLRHVLIHGNMFLTIETSQRTLPTVSFNTYYMMCLRSLGNEDTPHMLGRIPKQCTHVPSYTSWSHKFHVVRWMASYRSILKPFIPSYPPSSCTIKFSSIFSGPCTILLFTSSIVGLTPHADSNSPSAKSKLEERKGNGLCIYRLATTQDTRNFCSPVARCERQRRRFQPHAPPLLPALLHPSRVPNLPLPLLKPLIARQIKALKLPNRP